MILVPSFLVLARTKIKLLAVIHPHTQNTTTTTKQQQQQEQTLKDTE